MKKSQQGSTPKSAKKTDQRQSTLLSFFSPAKNARPESAPNSSPLKSKSSPATTNAVTSTPSKDAKPAREKKKVVQEDEDAPLTPAKLNRFNCQESEVEKSTQKRGDEAPETERGITVSSDGSESLPTPDSVKSSPPRGRWNDHEHEDENTMTSINPPSSPTKRVCQLFYI